MRVQFASINERSVVVQNGKYFDVHTASDGRFGPDPMVVIGDWKSFHEWEQSTDARPDVDFDQALAGPVVPRPRQVFGIGLNYRLHALEAGQPIPEVPLVFTKFPSCVVGPAQPVVVPTTRMDWEVELAVVIGQQCEAVRREEAWDFVAGVTLAQDFSARDVQMTPAGAPQYSLGKSFPGFLPLGPVLVTPDELPDRDGVDLWCEIDGVRMQEGCTDDLIFPVPVLIEYLSSVLPLFPGDIILTGTPAGVGIGRTPPVFLKPGQTVTTGGGGLGIMTQALLAPAEEWEWTA